MGALPPDGAVAEYTPINVEISNVKTKKVEEGEPDILAPAESSTVDLNIGSQYPTFICS